ncbi:MAG: 5-bromo-4-chloroindolyl phosphate hydrolysis family protein [Firmicutes bacterium]|nr:5-bromo-4-chloroindolyl phosphate hydrolysis family protein [Bacillota bacterium]
MNSRRKQSSELLGILAIIFGFSILRRLIPVLASLLKWLLIIGTGGLVAMIISIIIKGTKDSNNETSYERKVNDTTAHGQGAPKTQATPPQVTKNMPNLSPQQAQTIREAGRVILQSRMTNNRIRNVGIRTGAEDALKKAENIVAVLRQQPEEIRRCNQFFNYYLPTLQTILEKYVTLESSGVDLKESTDKTLNYLDEIREAFDKQYDNLFKDEKLDLTVEIEAMQLALRRDGLIDSDLKKAAAGANAPAAEAQGASGYAAASAGAQMAQARAAQAQTQEQQ